MTHPLPVVDVAPHPTAALHPVVPPDACEPLATVFKALGDPVRLRLFSIIAAADDPLCVCHIPDVGVSQPTVSHHLRKLREAGLVACERRGTWVHYWATDAGRRHAGNLRGLAEGVAGPAR